MRHPLFNGKVKLPGRIKCQESGSREKSGGLQPQIRVMTRKVERKKIKNGEVKIKSSRASVDIRMPCFISEMTLF